MAKPAAVGDFAEAGGRRHAPCRLGRVEATHLALFREKEDGACGCFQ